MTFFRPARPAVRRAVAVGAALVIVVTTVVAAPVIAPAQAAGPFEINSLLWNGGPDAAPGNGVCADAGGRCTLRAALSEANAAGGNSIVTVAPGFAGGTITVPDCAMTQYMATSGVPITTAAYFAITAPNVTLDLQNKIALSSPDCVVTALYVNGANAIVQNVSSFFSGGPSFTVGADGDAATFANLTLQSTATSFPDSAVTVATGADNVTVRGSVFSGFSTGASVAEGTVAVVGVGAAVNNLRIVGNTFTNDLSSTVCNSGNARGCRRSGVTMSSGATVNGLVIQNNTFSNYTNIARAPIAFGATAFSLANLAIVGNRFTAILSGGDTSASSHATITLPNNSNLTGTNSIRGNVFVGATGAQSAIFWNSTRPLLSTIPSNLTISENYIDGYGANSASTIGLIETGSVTVERNTFGPASIAAITAGAETSDAALLANRATSANRDIQGFSPSTPPIVDNSTCTLSFTAATLPGTPPVMPARLDVYWSASTSSGAEILLGSQTTSTFSSVAVTVPYTSNAPGRIRIQTIGSAPVAGGQPEASQYSSVVVVGASTCGPTVTIDQAAGQGDPSSTRALRFSVRSSASLATSGAGALTASDFLTAGSTAPGAQVVSVTRVSSTQYDVVATANDSGTVVLSLPAGVVADAANAASTNVASTSTDNSVTYQNPLSRAPAALTVYQGAPAQLYTITRAATGAPPTAPISVAVAPSNAFVTAPSLVTLASGSFAVSVPVTAAADLGGTDRTTVLTHTVTSADPEYNGLLLAPVTVTARLGATLTPTSGPTDGGQSVAVTVTYLPAAVTGIRFGTVAATFTGTGGALTAVTPPYPLPTGVNVPVDVTILYADGTSLVLSAAYTYVPTPAVTIQKRAYADAARTQQIASGSVIAAGQHVYWTYTVVNTGQTPLAPLTVTDPQLPAATYPGGLVCTVASLAAGGTTSCAADAVVTP